MKTKCVLSTAAFMSVAIALVMSSVTISVLTQPIFATLLEKNTLTDQEKLGDLLLPNETDIGQTSQQGNKQIENQTEEPLVDTTKSDIITQQKAGPILQDLKDSALVDRIFPKILDKLDGATILKKVDGQILLQKVLPYLDVKIAVAQTNGNHVKYAAGENGGTAYTSASDTCIQEEGVMVGGGFSSDISVSQNSRGVEYKNKDSWEVQIPPGPPNRNGYVTAYAECLKIELGIKAPSSAPTDNLPPGGGPLIPPSNDNSR